jgi:hypothetical protein
MRMRFTIYALALTVLAAAPAAAQSLDEKQFTAEMQRRMAEATKQPLRIAGRLEIHGTKEEVGEFIFYLDRIFQYCSTAEAEECERSKADYVAAMGDALKPLQPLRREQLRLLVRDQLYCREVAEMTDKPERRTFQQPLAPGICVLLAADFPRTRRMVVADDLDDLKIGEAAAWLAARERTLKATFPLKDVSFDDGATALTGGDYLPSVLLDSEGWGGLAARAGDVLIVAVPSDQLITITRASNVADMAELQRATRELYETAERGISPLVYRWNGNGWSVIE